ncbi:MAG TPA: hypothetical protein VHF69_03645, partial [Candidatus Synoicihabitans sp.]|nr:hypothetical protein [Candidatus Synoicihabitans sp.]
MTSLISSFSCRAAGLAALLLSLASPARVAAIPAQEAATAKPGKIIDVSTMKALFKKHDKVAIAGYQVAFVTRNKATAHAMNLLGSGTAKASLETFLGNVDYALMQEIADAAYADFAAKLAEAGVQVVPRETVQAARAFQQLETTPASANQAYKVAFQGAHYVIVPADVLPLWFNRYDGLAGGKGSGKNLKVMAELSKELGAVVLHPSIAVDFAYLDTSGGKFSKRASVDAQNGMLVVPAASVFWA